MVFFVLLGVETTGYLFFVMNQVRHLIFLASVASRRQERLVPVCLTDKHPGIIRHPCDIWFEGALEINTYDLSPFLEASFSSPVRWIL